MTTAARGTTTFKFGRAATVYVKRFGWAVFPLAARSKLPAIKAQFGGKGCLDATSDIEQIWKWWEVDPYRNIGIATGPPSGIFVLDVDTRHGGEETLANLVSRHGGLPETVVSRTGGGGEHFVFRHVPGIRNSSGRLGPGLDIRGEGGYIVAPPSVHENGRPYAWDVDRHPTATSITEAPSWLIEALQEKRGTGHAELPETWRRLVADGVEEGQRNEAAARLSGHLLRRYVDPLVVLDLLRCWNATRCRPPLDDDELVRSVDSIARREMQRRNEVSNGR